jgi:hypothetical protein
LKPASFIPVPLDALLRRLSAIPLNFWHIWAHRFVEVACRYRFARQGYKVGILSLANNRQVVSLHISFAYSSTNGTPSRLAIIAAATSISDYQGALTVARIPTLLYFRFRRTFILAVCNSAQCHFLRTGPLFGFVV